MQRLSGAPVVTLGFGRDLIGVGRFAPGGAHAALLDDAQAVDWGLHDRMVDALGNEILSEIYRVNSLHVRLIALDSSQIAAQRVLPAMQEHLVFIEALRRT